ncbi:MAG: site-2 protease family protein, partial [Bacillota bacterium]
MSKKFKQLLVVIFVALLIITPTINVIDANANAYSEFTSVYLGGTPIGVVAQSDGVIVTELTSVIGKNGTVNPAIDGGIKVGDFVYRIDNTAIKSPEDITTAIDKLAGVSATVYLKRGDEELKLQVTPVFDVVHNSKKLGILVKNEIVGVGTLTFVT